MIERAKASDPEAAESEWGGGFCSDIAAFLDDETIERAVDYSRPLEIPPRRSANYAAFVDPSGGRHDHFTLAIGHREGVGSGSFYVCDALRGFAPPFDPQSAIDEFAALLKDYRVSSVTGDNYSAAWAKSGFARAGIRYKRSEIPKSQLYLESLPVFMRNAISIPDHPCLLRELRLLERRASRLGKDVVDHGRNGSDDYANALAGMLHGLSALGQL